MNSKVCQLVITDGREGVLERTLNSWDEKLVHKPFDYTVLVDDSASPEYQNWLRSKYAIRFNLMILHGERKGFDGAIQSGWSNIPKDADFVFHLEDDFLLNRALFLDDWISILKANPQVAQIVSYRQPWSQAEYEIGGYIPLFIRQGHTFKNEFYKDENGKEWAVVEHRRHFSTNPCLYRRRIVEVGWPSAPGYTSEDLVGPRIFEKYPGSVYLIWGHKDDEPLVHHFGRSK